MRRIALFLLASFTFVAPAWAAPRKVSVAPMQVGKGLDAKSFRLLGEALVAELRKRPDIAVLSGDDVSALLTHEQQKQLLGCDDSACFSELGRAMASDELVTSSVGKLGKSWVLYVRRIDVQKAAVVRQVDRRLKKKRPDDLVDALPAVVTELFDTSDVPAPTATAAIPEVPTDCAIACAHVLACKGQYVDGDLDVLSGKDECAEACEAGVALGEDPESPRKKGRRAAAWKCTPSLTDCLDLDKRCDVF